MANPITDGPTAKRHKTAPVPGDPKRGIRPELDGPDPEIVIEAFRDVVVFVYFREIRNLAINVFESITSGVNSMNLADGPRPNPFAEPADGITGMTLIAELSDNFVFMRGRDELAHLFDRVSERFFAINVFAAFHRFHGNEGVGVIWSADDHAFDFLAHLIEHHAIIGEAPGIRIFGEFLGGIIFIDIAERDDVVTQASHLADVGTAAAADADAGDVNFAARTRVLGAVHETAG